MRVFTEFDCATKAYPLEVQSRRRGETGKCRHAGKIRIGNPTARLIQDAACRALITLGSDPLETQGRQLRFVAGMQLSAEIRLGRRGVLEYLLSPVQKITHEAGRER